MFKIHFKYIFSLLLFGVSGSYKAQDTLSLPEVIETVLKNNYGLRVAENSSEIASNNKSYGNAGFLPKVDLRADQNFSVNNSEIQFISGETIDRNNAKSNSLNAGVYLEWTLFDGMARFTDYSLLTEESKLSKLEKENQMETAVAEATNTYYGLVKEQQKLEMMKNILEYSRFRKNLTREKYELGAASKTTYLQAKVDYNTDSSLYLQQKKRLYSSTTALLQLMSKVDTGDFKADTTVPVKVKMELDALKKDFIQNNIRLEIAEKQKQLAVLEYKKAKSGHFPELKLNTSYDVLRSQSEAGFVSSNQNLGFNYGISLSYSLFNGFNVNRKRQNAKIKVESSELQYRETQVTITNELRKNWKLFRENQAIYALEKENLAIARENMELGLEKYKLGSISALELREIQENYINSYNRYIDARYVLKVDETKLLLLSGRILK